MGLAIERQIEKAKLVDYLLHPANSRGKAAFFIRHGFTPASWEQLRDALLEHAANMTVISELTSSYGIRYLVSGVLKTPSKHVPPPLVLAVWQHDTGARGVRLITAYPG